MAVEADEWLVVKEQAYHLLALNEPVSGPRGIAWFKDPEKRKQDRRWAAVLWAATYFLNAGLMKLAGRDGYPPVYEMCVPINGRGEEVVLKKLRTHVWDSQKLERAVAGESTLTDRKADANFVDPRVRKDGWYWPWIRRHSFDDLATLKSIADGELFLFGPRPLTLEDMKWAVELMEAGNQNAKTYVEAIATVAGAVGLPELTVRHRASFSQRLELGALDINEANRRSDEKKFVRLLWKGPRGEGK